MLFKKPIIEFFCHPSWKGVIPEPKPASKFISDWFKRIPPYTKDRDTFGTFGMTAKKCLPMLDAMSLGYVIPLQGDLHVQSNIDVTIVNVTNPPGIKICEYHSLDQIGGKTAPSKAPPLKFLNHWVVKTKPGYSTLFMPLLNNLEETRFSCFSAVVDTDKYQKLVNFPAVWLQKCFDDIVPAGTPLVVAIPFKRSDVPKTPIIRQATAKEWDNVERVNKQQDTRLHVYTHELREQRK